MARNGEKAMAMLNKWVKLKQTLNQKERPAMPLDPQDCPDLGNAEYYRESIIKELIKKVSDIQNARLGEMRIRDLNDEIN